MGLHTTMPRKQKNVSMNFCVLTQNINPGESEEEDRMKTIQKLSEFAEKMKKSLLSNQDVTEFKKLVTEEEKRKVDIMKCRLYSDLPTTSISVTVCKMLPSCPLRKT